ncbi:MAG TPA: ROK family transcriptional regulator [Mycobacteriales bacterium]|nr:ROK family transcriptional regulator [Mycobacteriales bacterium]
MPTRGRTPSASGRSRRTRRPTPLPSAGAPGQVAALLRAAGPLTRADLAGRLGLSRATVSAALTRLSAEGLVEERDEPAPSTQRGRPPGLVSLTRPAGVALGVDLGRRHVRVAVADLGHNVLAERHERFDVDWRPDEALDEVITLVSGTCADAGVDIQDALGLGLGLPAPLDTEGRPSAHSIPPGWVGHVPADELASRLGVPVAAENDANLGALAEAHWGAGRGHDSLVYVKAATGIGAGIVLRGSVFRGAGGTAGELGHTTTGDDGAVCQCGNRGCLEVRAGGAALVAQVLQSGVSVSGLPDLVARAREGHLGCRRVLADAGDAIGLALATVVNLLNPDRIVLGGELGTAGDLVLESLRARLSRNAIAPAVRQATVVPALLGDRAEVLGAVLLVLREGERFAPPPRSVSSGPSGAGAGAAPRPAGTRRRPPARSASTR